MYTPPIVSIGKMTLVAMCTPVSSNLIYADTTSPVFKNIYMASIIVITHIYLCTQFAMHRYRIVGYF